MLKDATDKSELLASFMGILELIKLRRILFCDDEDTPFSITSKFKLNPDYVPETDDEEESSDIESDKLSSEDTNERNE